jgi:hypothetical protein
MAEWLKARLESKAGEPQGGMPTRAKTHAISD